MSASELDAEFVGAAARWRDESLRYTIHSLPGHTGEFDVALAPTRPVVRIVGPRLEHGPERRAVRVARRTADIGVATVGLVLTLPVFVVLLIAIRTDSRGPALFRQPRVGCDGTVFTMFKFRTMFEDAVSRQRELERHNESIGGVLFKMRTDPRVTRVGRILRMLNLDEIPQLLNVLLGHMSIVGPRPLPLRDSRLLETYSPREYHLRLAVKPGITGEWQIRRTPESDYSNMLQLDMEYLDSRSLRHDGRIVLMTFVIMLRTFFARRSNDG